MMKTRLLHPSVPVVARLLTLLLALSASPGATAGDWPGESPATTEPTAADLELTLRYSDGSVVAGGRTAHLLMVQNHGPGDATNVMVESLLPEGLTLVSSDGCGEDPLGAPVCTVGQLRRGEIAVVQLIAEADAEHSGRLSAGARLQADQTDLHPANNSVETVIAVVEPASGAADLQLTLISSEGGGRPRSDVRSVFRVTNHGPDSAEDVRFHYPRPINLSNISLQSCNPRPADCYLGDLAPGDEVEMVVTAFVSRTPAGPIVDGTSVLSERSDPNPGNNRVPADPQRVGEHPLQITFDGMGSGSVMALPEDGSGALRCGSGSTSCESLFSTGSVVTLTARLGRGSRFIGWSGDCVDIGGYRGILTMDGPKQCTAGFEGPATLTVSTTGPGEGTLFSDPAGIRCGFPARPTRGDGCRALFEAGTLVTLSAHPAPGSTFDHWSGDPGCESGSVMVDVNRNCTAHFSLAEIPPDGLGILSGGYRHSIALADDGSVWSWGRNDNGELGDGTTDDWAVPQRLTGLPPIRQVAANNHHSGALDRDGQVWQWGSDRHGDLGLGGDGYYSSPLLVDGLPRIVQYATGYYTHAAVAEDGTVWSWGPDWYGQMGDGQFNGSPVATQVSDLTEVAAVTSGGHHNLALRADGSVWAWGRNQYGQLGDGSTENRNLPVRVEALQGVVQIGAGASFSLAVTADGKVWCWGDNRYGQIGDGGFEERHTPTPVRHRGRVTGIAAGAYHAAALLETGTVLTWGRGDNGQLGNGGYEHSPLPVRVIDIDDAEAIGAGSYHLLIRRGDGSVWGWGLDAQGGLGDGTPNHSHARPVAASGFVLSN